MEFKLPSGHIFYLNNLVSMLILGIALYWISWHVAQKKYDKAYHTGISAGLTIFFLWLFVALHIQWGLAPLVTLLIGVGKEVWDLFNPEKKKFDFYDLLSDAVGILCITLPYLFSIVLHNPNF